MGWPKQLKNEKNNAQEARDAQGAAGGAEDAGGSEDESSEDEGVGEEDEELHGDPSPERDQVEAPAPVSDVVVGTAISRYFEDVQKHFVGIVVRIVEDSSRVYTVVYPEDLDVDDDLGEEAMQDQATVTIEPDFKDDIPAFNHLQAVSKKGIRELREILGDELSQVREEDLAVDIEACKNMYGKERHGLWFHMRQALVLRELRLRLVKRLLEALGRNS